MIAVAGGSLDAAQARRIARAILSICLSMSSSVTSIGRKRHHESRVSRNRHGRPDLDHRVEGDSPFVGAGDDVDVGRRDRVHLGVHDGLRIHVGQGVADRLLPQDRRPAEPRLENLAWTLPGLKPGTRELPCESAGRLAHRLVDLVLVHLDREADPVPLDSRGGGSHRSHHCTGPPGCPTRFTRLVSRSGATNDGTGSGAAVGNTTDIRRRLHPHCRVGAVGVHPGFSGPGHRDPRRYDRHRKPFPGALRLALNQAIRPHSAVRIAEAMRVADGGGGGLR